MNGTAANGLVWEVLQESHRLLNDRYRTGRDPNTLGIYMEIENDKVMRFRNDAVWRENGMNVVYIGQTPEERHIRVWYFDGARVPPNIRPVDFDVCSEGLLSGNMKITPVIMNPRKVKQALVDEF